MRSLPALLALLLFRKYTQFTPGTVALALLRVMALLCTDGFTGLLFNVKEGKSGSEIILNLSERTIMTMSDSNWIHSSILFRLF